MNSTIKRRFRFWLMASLFAAAILGAALYPSLWRCATYHTVRHMIERGDEDAAVREVERLSRKRFFKPDWTTAAVMPSWRWVQDLDARLFGCPTCRGNWQPLLQHAARQGKVRLVATLIASGASVEYFGDRGCQVLQSAVFGGNTNIIATLVSRGADVNATNIHGPLLHTAAGFCRKPEVLQWLLDAGAKPNVTDSQGWTALDWASVWNKGAKPLLVAHGAMAGTNRRISLPNSTDGQTNR